MPILIQTEAQNEAALAVLDKLLDALNGALGGNETLIGWTHELCHAIEDWESKNINLDAELP